MLQTQRDAYAVLRRHYSPPNLMVRVYNLLRIAVVPVPWLSGLLKRMSGDVLCLGCGYGTLETVLAVDNPQLQFSASDFNQDRIRSAQHAVTSVDNIAFEVSDVTVTQLESRYDNVFFSDLLHHLPAGDQEPLLTAVWDSLKPGGMLLVKDVDTRPRWKFLWNALHDRIVAGQPLTYLPMTYYADFLRSLGAEVSTSVPKTCLPYAHYAIAARRPG